MTVRPPRCQDNGECFWLLREPNDFVGLLPRLFREPNQLCRLFRRSRAEPSHRGSQRRQVCLRTGRGLKMSVATNTVPFMSGACLRLPARYTYLVR